MLFRKLCQNPLHWTADFQSLTVAILSFELVLSIFLSLAADGLWNNVSLTLPPSPPRFPSLAAVCSFNLGHLPCHWRPQSRMPLSVPGQCQQPLGNQPPQWSLRVCAPSRVWWVPASLGQLASRSKAVDHCCKIIGTMGRCLRAAWQLPSEPPLKDQMECPQSQHEVYHHCRLWAFWDFPGEPQWTGRRPVSQSALWLWTSSETSWEF